MEPRFRCSQCGKSFANKSNLNKHIHRSCKSTIKFTNNSKLDYPQNGPSKPDTIPTSNVSKMDNNIVSSEIEKSLKNQDHVQDLGQFLDPNLDYSMSSISTKIYKCKYCGKEFTRNNNWNRHVANNCKVKKQTIEEKEVIYQKLLLEKDQENKEMKDENKEMKDELQKLRQQITINNNNTNNNNSHNTSNNNIQINNEIKLIGFGDEDLYSINDKVVKKLLNKGLNSVLETIRYTHFHKYNEHHHNVYVSNMKDVYAMIYSGNRDKWIIEQKKEVVNQLYNDKHLFLEDKYKQLYGDLPPLTRKKFDKLLELSDDEDTVRIIKREILEMLYNEKDIPMRTRKKLEQIEKNNLKMIDN